MENSSFWISIIIFTITFISILSEKVHRSLIAFIGALWMVVAGHYMGFYSYEQVLFSVDFNTLFLL